jgi:uncharacterized protein (UPF0147 family)
MGRRRLEQIRRDRARDDRKQTARELAEIAVDEAVPPDVRQNAATILNWMAER